MTTGLAIRFAPGFKSHNDKAEYGGVLGGVINVVSKSGGNSVHGSAWYGHRTARMKDEMSLSHD
jgi:hypothetical protein